VKNKPLLSRDGQLNIAEVFAVVNQEDFYSLHIFPAHWSSSREDLQTLDN